jgi:hypothetical protein
MLGLHSTIAVLVVVACLLSFGWGGFYLWRRRAPGRIFAHLLALTQVLVIAQVGVGLILLSDGRRTDDQLHYLYGAIALGVILSPWIYAPPLPVRRLAWFSGASLVAGALAVRAYLTAG